jgi:DNA polymerase III psi subunit
MKEEDIFFLPFFIKEKVYVIDKEQFETSLGTENTLLPSEEITHAPPPDYLILHQEPSPLPTAQEELLQNILKAIHISQNQVEKKALSDFQPVHLQGRKFVFVLSPEPLPKPLSQLEKNKTRTLTEGTKALLSDSLSVLITNKQEKLVLWAELKRAFDIK